MKICRNQVTLTGKPKSITLMLIHMLTGYQPEDLFLPHQTTYNTNVCIWGQFTFNIREKVQSDIMTKGENKAFALSSSSTPCLKIQASGH